MKFIPTPYRTTLPSDLLQDRTGVNHLERSLRLAFFFLAHPPSNAPYNPRMCPASDWTPPEQFFPKILTRRLAQFKIRLHRLFATSRQVKSNLSLPHRHTLTYLRNQNEFLVVNCDKNLGPALIERDKYIRLAISDHLSDGDTYQALTADEAAHRQVQNAKAFQAWLQSYRDFLLEDEFNYLHSYAQEVTDPFPYFYLTMKVHKKPLKTRPIVSYSGSFFYGLGVWVDHYLKQAAVTLRSYLKSSFELRAELHNLVLPPGRYRLFTADATSMYTNINTAAAISAIHKYIEDRPLLFPAIPIHALTAAIEMIMTKNIFQFGDTHWRQLNGTAMGAPPAPSYATLSFGTHEETLLDEFEAQLAFYRRYIDDVFGIWRCHPDPIQDALLWTQFDTGLNSWHGLQWIVSARTNQVDFLDLTLTLDEGRISCTLFEKAQNLHLYLPPRSAHPPGMLFGVVAGTIYRARSLCSDSKDADTKILAFWRHLIARGYSASTLRPLFDKALKSVVPFLDRPPPAPTDPDRERLWLFKARFHPQDPPSSAIRQAWEATIASPPLSKPLNQIDVKFKTLGHRRFLVCYNRPPNLGNLLSYRKIIPTSGPPVSSFLE